MLHDFAYVPKNMKISYFLLFALAAVAQTGTGQTVSASVDASKTGAAISPYLYGQFVEHAGSLVYTGLWSEMLDDRKFHNPVVPATATPPDAGGAGRGPGRGRGPARRWVPIGPPESVLMDTKNPFVGEHSPLIKLEGSELRGIRQSGLSFVEGATYNGRIQLAGDPTAKVSVGIVWDANSPGGRQMVSLGPLEQFIQEVHLLVQGRKVRHGAIRNQRRRNRFLPCRRGFPHARR